MAVLGGERGRAVTLDTDRLRLRAWDDGDLAPFAAMSADPRVMEFYPRALERAQADAVAHRLQSSLVAQGFGFWAIEVPGVAGFVGCLGLMIPSFSARFMPCMDVGWRLGFEHWGRGYATEAGKAVLAHAFGVLGREEVVSFTVPGNVRSVRVMERLGMTRRAEDDFEHPQVPEGHRLRPHVLYRISRAGFEGR